MTQPQFVPIAPSAQVRPSVATPHTTHVEDRPVETRRPVGPFTHGFGAPGPDQGLAIKLATRLSASLQLQAGEDAHDIEIGVALLAARRAALFGRAPSIYDVQAIIALFGFNDAAAEAPLVAHRRGLFQAVGHSWEVQRALTDSVPQDLLRLKADEIDSGVRRRLFA